jgi:hypothetical protein
MKEFFSYSVSDKYFGLVRNSIFPKNRISLEPINILAWLEILFFQKIGFL